MLDQETSMSTVERYIDVLGKRLPPVAMYYMAHTRKAMHVRIVI